MFFYFIHRDTDPLLDHAKRKTRQFIRYARDVSTRYRASLEEIESLNILANDWSKSQAVLADHVKKQLSPWTSLTETLFQPSEIGSKVSVKLNSAVSIDFMYFSCRLNVLFEEFYLLNLFVEKLL